MEFFDKLMKQARGMVNAPSADQGRQQSENPVQRQPHSASEQQLQHNEASGMDEDVKEIRTYRRDGINIIEEYERLNPDGTVTKTISVGDKKNGLKKFEVYKMDKSGIVRRVESSDQGDAIPTEVVRDIWMSKFKNMANSPKETREYRQVETPSSNYDTEGRNQLINSQIKQYIDSLKPEQKTAIYNDFKEKVLAYGTNKLKQTLIPKLDDKGAELGLTDAQKVEILDHSILKLRRRLSDSVNEEKFFSEVWPRYEYFRNSEGSAEEPSSNQVSFALEPHNNTKQSEFSEKRPVSFVIRPEYGTLSYSEPPSQRKDHYEERQYNTWKDEKLYDEQMKRTIKHEPQRSEGIEDDGLDDTILQLQEHLKRHINENESTNKEEKQRKEACLDLALEKIRNKLKDGGGSSAGYHDGRQSRSEEDIHYKSDKNNGKPHSLDDTLDKLDKYFKRYVMKDSSNTSEDKEIKNNIIDFAMERLKNNLNKLEEEGKIKQPKKEKTKLKEEHSNKYESSDTDEDYDFGEKAFEKLLKKKLINSDQRDKFIKYLKKAGGSIKKLHSDSVRDDIKHDQQRRIREEINKNDFLETMKLDKTSNPWNDVYMRSAKPSLDSPPPDRKEKKTISFDSLLSKLKSQSSQKKELASSSSRDNNTFSSKCQPDRSTDNRSETQINKRKRDLLNMNALLDDIGEILFDVDEETKPTSSDRNEERNKYDSHFPQSRPLEVTGKTTDYESPKEKKFEFPDFGSVMSKLRENISQRMKGENDSVPKQVKLSSPYSYQKPCHGTTKINNRNVGTQQNEQNKISFQIHPKDYSKSTDSSYGNGHINNNKSDDGDFMPWWFGSSAQANSGSTYTKEPLIKNPPITNSFLGGSMLNDSFFDNFLGSNVSNPQLTGF